MKIHHEILIFICSYSVNFPLWSRIFHGYWLFSGLGIFADYFWKECSWILYKFYAIMLILWILISSISEKLSKGLSASWIIYVWILLMTFSGIIKYLKLWKYAPFNIWRIIGRKHEMRILVLKIWHVEGFFVEEGNCFGNIKIGVEWILNSNLKIGSKCFIRSLTVIPLNKSLKLTKYYLSDSF